MLWSSISEENTLVSWSIWHDKNGDISVRIRYKAAEETSNRDEQVHYRKKSARQVLRDQNHGHAWKANQRVINTQQQSVCDAVSVRQTTPPAAPEAISADVVPDWFDSYLSNRKQLIDLSGVKSSLENISCGVPQGSILGPLLFLMYVNDMEMAVNCKLLLYADDSALLIPGKDLVELENVLSEELRSVSEWLVDNRLSLHLGKTESILFGPKRKINVNPSSKIVCNSSEINHCSVVKYLGAELDQSLDGEVMAGKVLNKVYSRLKNLYRKSKFLNQNTKKLLASALVQCHYDYSCSFWYSSLSKQTKSKLQISQNKLVRFTLNLQPRTHLSSEHFKRLGWLPIDRTTGRTTKIKSCLQSAGWQGSFVPFRPFPLVIN